MSAFMKLIFMITVQAMTIIINLLGFSYMLLLFCDQSEFKIGMLKHAVLFW